MRGVRGERGDVSWAGRERAVDGLATPGSRTGGSGSPRDSPGRPSRGPMARDLSIKSLSWRRGGAAGGGRMGRRQLSGSSRRCAEVNGEKE